MVWVVLGVAWLVVVVFLLAVLRGCGRQRDRIDAALDVWADDPPVDGVVPIHRPDTAGARGHRGWTA